MSEADWTGAQMAVTADFQTAILIYMPLCAGTAPITPPLSLLVLCFDS